MIWCYTSVYPIIFIIFIPSKIVPYEQSDYILIIERAEILWYNKNYFSWMSIKGNKFNRTHVGINMDFSLKKDLQNRIRGHIQAFKFMSNEYRAFPIEIQNNVCSSMMRNEFGIKNIFEYGNFTGCPIIKGSYSIRNWIPDYSKFPPFMPSGNYKVAVKFMVQNDEIAIFNVYGAVQTLTDLKPPLERR